MKRTSRRYVVTTSALNCYLFRMLTAGLDFSQYEKNPVLLWMHMRPRGLSKDEILPLGRCVELKIEGDSITCYLEFDETDEFAMRIYNKYENGTLNMISAGVKPLEWSEDPEDMLPGQVGPTVTKGKFVEISAVDIGGLDDALPVTLYDNDDNIIKLADLTADGIVTLFNNLQNSNTNDKQKEMKLLTLSAPAATAILLQLKLAETATEVEVQQKVTELVTLSLDQASQILTLSAAKGAAENSLSEANAAKLELENKLKAKNQEEVKAYVQMASDQGKFLPGQIPGFIALMAKDEVETRKLIDAMPATKSVADTLKDAESKGDWFAKLSYDELDKSGKLIQLKSENLEAFKEKFLAKWKKPYVG